MVFLWQLKPFLYFPILHHILQNTCRLFRVVIFFLFSFFFFPFPLFLWSGLFSCVPVPCTLALPLLCPNELRLLFGLLCFAVVGDHRICMG